MFLEHRTVTPLAQVRFLGAARDFLPESTFSADSLSVPVHPRVQSHALTSVRTLKIPVVRVESSVDYITAQTYTARTMATK